MPGNLRRSQLGVPGWGVCLALSATCLGVAPALSGCDGDSWVIGVVTGDGTGGSTNPPSDDGAGGEGGGAAGSPSCDVPEPAIHFDFAGTGTSLVDLQGGPAAELFGGAALTGTGELELDGEDDYVELAERPWTGDTVSIALWVRFNGVSAYQRLFDFGASSTVEPVVGTRYLALTPRTGYFPDRLAVLLTDGGSGGEVAAVSDVILDEQAALVVVTVGAQSLQLFHSGQLITRVPHDVDLSALLTDSNWLGRSHYGVDPYAEATYLDLRFYGAALEPCQVQRLHEEGAP